MLVNFSVGNFRSFLDVETFSMKAGKTRNFSNRTTRIANTKTLKFKAIYGANSSGKSNLIKALRFMQVSVANGIPVNSTNDFCRLNENNGSKPSRFEVETILNGIYYIYGFEAILTENKFTKEWFLERKGQKTVPIFSRDIQKETYDIRPYTNSNALNERLSIYADDVKSDGSILFLRTMNQNKDALYTENSPIKAFQILYRWFITQLSINYPNEPITQYTYFFDSTGSIKAEKLLSRFDTGISKVSVYDEPTEKVMARLPKQIVQSLLDNLSEQKNQYEKEHIKDTPAVVIRSQENHSMYLIELNGEQLICKTLKFNHKHSDSLFTLRDESDGTVRLFDLIEVLLSNSKNMVYIIDEINRCLHPLITRQFITDFLDLATERDIQLIVTTHETGLMDLKLLRQDEIGFVEKDQDSGASYISSLNDYGARFDKQIRTAYMNGDYHAIPRITSKKI